MLRLVNNNNNLKNPEKNTRTHCFRHSYNVARMNFFFTCSSQQKVFPYLPNIFALLLTLVQCHLRFCSAINTALVHTT